MEIKGRKIGHKSQWYRLHRDGVAKIATK